jgi:transcriptional regulator
MNLDDIDIEKVMERFLAIEWPVRSPLITVRKGETLRKEVLEMIMEDATAEACEAHVTHDSKIVLEILREFCPNRIKQKEKEFQSITSNKKLFRQLREKRG